MIPYFTRAWQAISIYNVRYRCLLLSKIALALCYLWFCSDFIRIMLVRNGPIRELIPPIWIDRFSDNPWFNDQCAYLFTILGQPAVLLPILYVSPILMAIFLWGRWNFFVGILACATMVIVGAANPYFESSADSWLFWCFVVYTIAPRDHAGFSTKLWKENPVISSNFAGGIVLLEFTVYFFAGVSKIIMGSDQWLTGTALQNIAYDAAVYDAIRGIHVPYLISLVLCYVTLFQRLIVPFGFYFPRWRIWSFAILAVMHLGYACLMHVSLFPALGITCLILTLPTESKWWKKSPAAIELLPAPKAWITRQIAFGALLAYIVIFPTIQEGFRSQSSCALITGSLPKWSYAWHYPLRWEMFAAGGPHAKDTWRYIITKNEVQDIDITQYPLKQLPDIWRSRFFLDALQGDVYAASLSPQTPASQYSPILQLYIKNAQDLYLHQGPQALYITETRLEYHTTAKPPEAFCRRVKSQSWFFNH